jgi:predicted phosphodiesterase
MRVAALYDSHANPPALEAVLADVREARVDVMVLEGDVIPGPIPRQALALLLGQDIPPQCIHGNGDLAVLAQIGAVDPSAVTSWRTTSGEPPLPRLRDVMQWASGC